MTLVLGIRVILLLQDCDRVFRGVGLRNYHAINSIFSPLTSPQILRISPRSDDDETGSIAACSAEAVCASARSGPARQCSCPPRSGGLWCGLLVPKKGENAGLPACLIGAEVDLSTKNDRI